MSACVYGAAGWERHGIRVTRVRRYLVNFPSAIKAKLTNCYSLTGRRRVADGYERDGIGVFAERNKQDSSLNAA